MIDLMKGGTTTLVDMWHHGQEMFFDVAKELGLRTVGAPFIMSASNSRLGADGNPVWDFGNDGMAQLAKSIALFKARDEGPEGLAQVAIGPHATDTCLPELLRECRKAADELGCLLDHALRPDAAGTRAVAVPLRHERLRVRAGHRTVG